MKSKKEIKQWMASHLWRATDEYGFFDLELLAARAVKKFNIKTKGTRLIPGCCEKFRALYELAESTYDESEFFKYMR